MKNLIASVSFVAALLANAAFADQCAYLTKEQALAFASQVSVGQSVYHLCEPCGGSTEDGSVQVSKVESIGVAQVGSSSNYEVVINGKAVDLAYIYKKTATLANNNSVLVNAALLVSCATSGVTASFRNLGQ